MIFTMNISSVAGFGQADLWQFEHCQSYHFDAGGIIIRA